MARKTATKTPATEMLFELTNHGHRHVWAPCTVAETVDPDDYETPEEHAAMHCLATFGLNCAPHAVRDQFGKLVTR